MAGNNRTTTGEGRPYYGGAPMRPGAGAGGPPPEAYTDSRDYLSPTANQPTQRSFSGRMPVESYFNPAQGWQAQNLPGQPNNPNASKGFVNAGAGGPPPDAGDMAYTADGVGGNSGAGYWSPTANQPTATFGGAFKPAQLPNSLGEQAKPMQLPNSLGEQAKPMQLPNSLNLPMGGGMNVGNVGGYGQAPATGERQPRSFSGRMPVEPYFNPAQGWQAQNLPGQPNNPNASQGFVNAGAGGPPPDQGEVPTAGFQQVAPQANIAGMTKPAMLGAGAGGPPPPANLMYENARPQNQRQEDALRQQRMAWSQQQQQNWQQQNQIGAGSGGPPPNAGEAGGNTDPNSYVRNRNLQFGDSDVSGGVIDLQRRYDRLGLANRPGYGMDMNGNAAPLAQLGGPRWTPNSGQSYAWAEGANPASGTPSSQGGAPSQAQSGGNPNLQSVADSISRNFNRNFTEQMLPAIRGSSFVNGQVGGDRQGIAEGLAAARSQEGLASALASMYSNAYESDANRQMQGSIAAAGNQTQRDLGFGNLDVNRMQANTARDLGFGNLALNRDQANTARDLGYGNLDVNRMQANTARDLGFGNLGINQQQANTARDLGFGNLGINQQQANTARDLGFGNLALGRDQNNTARMLGLGNLGLNRQQSQNNFYTAQRGQDLDQMRLAAQLTGQGQQGLLGGMGSLFNSYQGQNNADRDQLSWYSSLFGPFMGANSTQTGQQGYTYNPTMQWLGTGAQLASAFRFSDRRLKENIKKVGKTDEGLNVYTYNYKGSDTPQMGVMAQDVEKKKPEAVVRDPSGFLKVNYGLLG